MKPLLPAVVLSLVAVAPAQAQDPDTLFQVSTLGALQVGLFQPAMSVGELKRHGSFGLGTFAGLDGEMVVDKGVVYQVPFSGRARAVPDRQQTPFAAVTHFGADQRFTVGRAVDLVGLGRVVDRRLTSLNAFAAVRATGRFSMLTTRSVPQQSKPYQPLSAAVAQQREFDLSGRRGTLVGIRSPAYVGSLNVAGYHWHFISRNGKAGGHVLAFEAEGLRVRVDELLDWKVQLPDTRAFRRAMLP